MGDARRALGAVDIARRGRRDATKTRGFARAIIIIGGVGVAAAAVDDTPRDVVMMLNMTGW
jgi:hypothetical protein